MLVWRSYFDCITKKSATNKEQHSRTRLHKENTINYKMNVQWNNFDSWQEVNVHSKTLEIR